MVPGPTTIQNIVKFESGSYIAWIIVALNIVAFLCTFYCFVLKDNTREPIMLESDRIAIKYSLADLDSDTQVEAEVAKRVTIGHDFSVFHRMHLAKLQSELRSEFDEGEGVEMPVDRKVRRVWTE